MAASARETKAAMSREHGGPDQQGGGIMASISAFERISLAEANVKATVKTVNRQAIDIQILQAQIATIMTRIPRDAQEPPAKLELARPLARMADIASRWRQRT